MPDMAEHMRALAEATGWTSVATPDSAGVYRVSLENDLDATFFALNGRTCLMRGIVTELPASEAEALCAEAASKQVAVLRERPSILALEEAGEFSVPGENSTTPRLICFRCVPLSIDRETFVLEVQGLLNDLSWWKATMGHSETDETHMNAIFSAEMFSGLKL